MGLSLEKIHHFSSIGTFVFTVVLVVLTVVPMVWPRSDPPRGSVVGWIMPSVLALALVCAALIHLKAARVTKETRTLPNDTPWKQSTEMESAPSPVERTSSPAFGVGRTVLPDGREIISCS